MSISSSIARVTMYLRRNGLRATAVRVTLAARRALFSNRNVLFYCDIPTQSSPATDLPSSLSVERHRKQTDLSPQDLQEIISFWNPKLAERNLQERFMLGASLWLIKFEDQLAGYGWTLQGCTVEPHYFPLGECDVQFLDFHVFPKYRGRAIDWILMTEILSRLAADGMARAFGEAAEWNKASLSSFAMTPFRRLGWGRKFTILGRTFVCWTQDKALEQKDRQPKAPLPASRGKPTSVQDLGA
jgi:ribosomal protein S18 acetylase RimI-like enzyme